MHQHLVLELRKLLESRGIECEVRGEYGPAAMGEVPMDAWPELWLFDESRLDEVRAIIADFDDPGSAREVSWSCPKCREYVEGQFTECWKCGAARPAKDR